MTDCFALWGPTRVSHGALIACSSVARQPFPHITYTPQNNPKKTQLPLIEVQIFTPKLFSKFGGYVISLIYEIRSESHQWTGANSTLAKNRIPGPGNLLHVTAITDIYSTSLSIEFEKEYIISLSYIYFSNIIFPQFHSHITCRNCIMYMVIYSSCDVFI